MGLFSESHRSGTPPPRKDTAQSVKTWKVFIVDPRRITFKGMSRTLISERSAKEWTEYIYIYQDTIVGGTLNGGRVSSCNVLSVHWLHEWVEGPVYNDSVGAHFDREAGNRTTESNWKLLRADHFGCSPVEQRSKTVL